MLGAVTGSFLNVCIDRLPRGQSLLHPPSHCPQCQQHLRVPDLIPIISYLWLRGRCRICGAGIPLRIVIVETLTAVLFACLWWYYGFHLQLLFFILFSCLFIVLFFIDLEHGLILNKIVYPAIVVVLCIAPFRPDLVIPGSLTGISILNALIGGGVAFGIFLAIVFLSRGGMGWGDVKMALLIGLVTGYPLILVALLISIFSGAVLAILLIVFRLRKRRDPIPFGPFLSVGALSALFWGSLIYNWWINLF